MYEVIMNGLFLKQDNECSIYLWNPSSSLIKSNCIFVKVLFLYTVVGTLLFGCLYGPFPD